MLVNSTKISLFRFSAIMSSGRFGELPIFSYTNQFVIYTADKKAITSQENPFSSTFINSPNFLSSRLFSNVARLFSVLDLVTLQFSAFSGFPLKFSRTSSIFTLLHQFLSSLNFRVLQFIHLVQHFAILQFVFPEIDSTGLFSKQNIIIIKLGPYGTRQPDPISRKNFPKYNNFKIYFFFVTLTKFSFCPVLLFCYSVLFAVCLLSFLGLDCYDENLTRIRKEFQRAKELKKKSAATFISSLFTPPVIKIPSRQWILVPSSPQVLINFPWSGL